MFTPPASPAPVHSHGSIENTEQQGGANHRPDALLAPPRSGSPCSSSSSSRSSSPSPSLTPTSTSSPDRCVTSLGKEHRRTLAKKRRIARRTKWTILFVPLALVFITLSTRYLSHPAVLDLLSPDCSTQDWAAWATTLADWRPHRHSKREPDPDPKQTSETSSGASYAKSSPTSSSTAASASPGKASPTIPTIPATPPVLPTPFPQPFDTTLSQNFSTEGCYEFFLNMTQTEPFRACRPFSLLLQSSSEFIEAQTNVTLLNSIIWGTCNTSPSTEECTANMAWFADELQSVCAVDLKASNEQATSTLLGLQVYSLMRSTACLPNATSNAYCFLDAVFSAHPADAFFYSLPLGVAFPNSSVPSCGACTQDVMAEYVNQGLNSTGLRATYAGAAVVANGVCGGGYVQELQEHTSAAGRIGDRMMWWVGVGVGAALLGVGGAWW